MYKPVSCLRLRELSFASAILSGVSLPVSTAAANILLAFSLLCLLAAGGYKQQWYTLRHHPLALSSIALFAWLVLGLSYSSAPWSESLSTLGKYRELLYIPLFIIIFQTTSQRRTGIDAFLAVMLVILLLSYTMAYTGLSFGKGSPDNPFVFKNHITQNILMALLVYMLAVRALLRPHWRWAYAGLALLAGCNVLFMTQGRSGYVVLFALAMLWFYQFFRWCGLLWGILLLSLLAGLGYDTSDTMHRRVDITVQALSGYQTGDSDRSTVLRLEFLRNSLHLIAARPWMGSGTGSFSTEYLKLVNDQGMLPSENPHGEFLMLGIQLGALGVALFVLLLATMWRLSRELRGEAVWLAQGLVVMMATGCLFNSLLLDFTEAHVFAYLGGLLFAGLDQPPE